MMRRHVVSALAIMCAAGAAASVQAKDIKIAHIYCKTGILEAYAKQTQVGLQLGLDYATKGTNGRQRQQAGADRQG